MSDTKNTPTPAQENVSEEAESVRARPGRRTAEERKEAVLALLAGKATVDELARRYGVYPATVEGWREEAVKAVEATFRKNTKSTRETELEKENRTLRDALTESSIQVALLKRANESRPSLPARSRK